MDAAVALVHLAGGEAGFLKLPVHIAGENPRAAGQARGPAAQDVKARVRRGAAIKLQAVAVKAPGQARIALEGGGLGHLGEGQAGRAQGGIGAPEAFVTAKVGQAGVHTHARTGANNQRLRLAQQVGGAGQRVAGVF